MPQQLKVLTFMHDNLNIIPGSQDETKKLTPGVNIWPPYECHGCAMHSQTHTL